MKIWFWALLILFLILAIPYTFRILELKTLTRSDIPEEGGWAPLSLGNIYYQSHSPYEDPNGQIVVLVHGFSSPSFVWNGMMEDLLKAGYKVVVFDHYGRGFSERPKASYDKNLYVTELKELLEHLEITDPVHLVGYSMGGPIVSFFADEHSQQVASLTLIAPAGFAEPSSIPSFSNIMFLPLIGDWFYNVFRGRFQEMMMPESESSKDPRSISQSDFKKLFSQQFEYKGLIEALLSTLRNLDMFSVLDMYTRVGESNKPVLVIWGKLDGVVPHFQSDQLIEAIPQAELVTIEEGTHDITYRHPSQVGEAIAIFLSNLNK